MIWFNCTIKYQKLNEEGILQPVSEQLLVNALNFTEVENKIIASKSEEIRGEFFITRISKDNLEDIVKTGSEDYWFKAKVIIVDITDSGKEKKFTKFFYISSFNFVKATEEMEKYLKNAYLVDCYINSLSLTKITTIIG